MQTKHMSKDEVREDHVVTAVLRAGEYIRKNVRWILGISLVLVAAVISLVLVTETRSRAEEAASAELMEAKSLYFSNDFVGASTQLQELSKRRGSTRAVREARIFHANSELAIGNPSGAEALYREFLASDAAKDPVLKSAGFRGLGAALAVQGRFKEAAAEYNSAAATKGNLLAADDLLQAALLMRRSGEIVVAIETLRKLLDSYPTSQLAGEARVRLQEFLAIR